MFESIARVTGFTITTLTILVAFHSPVGRGAPQAHLGATVAALTPGHVLSAHRLDSPLAFVWDFEYDADDVLALTDEGILANLLDADYIDSGPFALYSYEAKEGESLRVLALRLGLSPDALGVLNEITPLTPLRKGQRVTLYQGPITVHTIASGETLGSISSRYGTDVELLKVCNHLTSDRIVEGTRLFVPLDILERVGEAFVEPEPAAPKPKKVDRKKKAPAKPSPPKHEKVLNHRARPLADSGLSWPVKGKISSRYGWRLHPILKRNRFHTGLDISVPSGHPIQAVAEGRVIYAGWRGASGKTVVIRHTGGLVSIYAHCSRFHVEKGQKVVRGQLIARVGSTGRSTGSHLHFALKKNGKSVDPQRMLP